jgi:hypothetical protein
MTASLSRAQQYRNGIPQHHQRDLLSSGDESRIFVLSGQLGCGCGEFGTTRPSRRLIHRFIQAMKAPKPTERSESCPSPFRRRRQKGPR